MLNWDFEPQKVCRASYQLIRITRSRPLITIDERVYSFVEELVIIKVHLFNRDLIYLY